MRNTYYVLTLPVFILLLICGVQAQNGAQCLAANGVCVALDAYHFCLAGELSGSAADCATGQRCCTTVIAPAYTTGLPGVPERRYECVASVGVCTNDLLGTVGDSDEMTQIQCAAGTVLCRLPANACTLLLNEGGQAGFCTNDCVGMWGGVADPNTSLCSTTAGYTGQQCCYPRPPLECLPGGNLIDCIFNTPTLSGGCLYEEARAEACLPQCLDSDTLVPTVPTGTFNGCECQPDVGSSVTCSSLDIGCEAVYSCVFGNSFSTIDRCEDNAITCGPVCNGDVLVQQIATDVNGQCVCTDAPTGSQNCADLSTSCFTFTCDASGNEATCQPQSTCDDGDLCTVDNCNGGTCIYTPVDCDDGNDCTIDSCLLDVCENLPAPNGQFCGTGPELCEIFECMNGSCDPTGTIRSCDDGNPCTYDVCTGLGGGGNDGICNHEPLVCDDPGPCGTASCDPLSAPTFPEACVTTPIVCNDGNPCTIDSCDNLVGCVTTPLSCPQDQNRCTDEVCVPSDGMGNPCAVPNSSCVASCVPEANMVCEDGTVEISVPTSINIYNSNEIVVDPNTQTESVQANPIEENGITIVQVPITLEEGTSVTLTSSVIIESNYTLGMDEYVPTGEIGELIVTSCLDSAIALTLISLGIDNPLYLDCDSGDFNPVTTSSVDLGACTIKKVPCYSVLCVSLNLVGCISYTDDCLECLQYDIPGGKRQVIDPVVVLDNYTIIMGISDPVVFTDFRVTRLPLERYNPGCVLGYGYWRHRCGNCPVGDLPRTIGTYGTKEILNAKTKDNAWLRTAKKYLIAVFNYDCLDNDAPYGMIQYIWSTFEFLNATGYEILPHSPHFEEAIQRAIVLDDYANGLNTTSSCHDTYKAGKTDPDFDEGDSGTRQELQKMLDQERAYWQQQSDQGGLSVIPALTIVVVVAVVVVAAIAVVTKYVHHKSTKSLTLTEDSPLVDRVD